MKKPYSIVAIAAFMLLLSACSTLPLQHEADDSDTINPVPTPGASFATALGTFSRQEDAGREYEHNFVNYVYSGCLGSPVAGLVMTPSSCTAYNKGVRAGATLGAGGGFTSSITFQDNSTTWVAIDQNRSGANAGLPTFSRAGTSHYLIDSTSGTQPTMPADAQILMKVVTAGGAITAVTDLRNLKPLGVSQLPTSTRYVACDGTNSDAANLQAKLNAGAGRVQILGAITCNYGTTATPLTTSLTIPPNVILSGDSEESTVLSLHTTGGGVCVNGVNGGITIFGQKSQIRDLKITSDNTSLDCLVNWSTAAAIGDVMSNVKLGSTAAIATTNPIGIYMNNAVTPLTQDVHFVASQFRQPWSVNGATNGGVFIHTTLALASDTPGTVDNRALPMLQIGASGAPQGNRWIATICETGPNCVEEDAGYGNSIEIEWYGDTTAANMLGTWTPNTALPATGNNRNFVLQATATTTGRCHTNTTLDNLSASLYLNEPIAIACGAAGAVLKTRVTACGGSTDPSACPAATSVTMADAASITDVTDTKLVYEPNYTALGCWRASSTGGTTGATQPVWPASPTPGTTQVTDNGITWVNFGPCAAIFLNGNGARGTIISNGYYDLLNGGVVNNNALGTAVLGGLFSGGQYGVLGLGSSSIATANLRLSTTLAGVAVRGSGMGYQLGKMSYDSAVLHNLFDLGGTSSGDALATSLSDVSGPDITRWHSSVRDSTLANNADSFVGGTFRSALTVGSGGTKFSQIKKYTPTLSPSIVNANTCAGQDLTVSGVTTADHIVECLKPTEQAGLSSPVCRVKSPNTVTMNFCNTTGAGITPTATEVYSITAVTF